MIILSLSLHIYAVQTPSIYIYLVHSIPDNHVTDRINLIDLSATGHGTSSWPCWHVVCHHGDPWCRDTSEVRYISMQHHKIHSCRVKRKPPFCSIDFQQRHFQNGRLAAILDFSVSGLCRWQGFRYVSQVCFGISISNFICMLMVVIGKSLLIFSEVTLKMAPGGHIGCFGFQTLTLVWLWISTPNLNGTILMNMRRSLLIFSNVNFKMAARQPYWNFWFPDSNFSLALNINCKLKWHNTYIYG